MVFHHKIKPHHHVSIWIISVLTVLAMASVYTNAVLSSLAEDRPSEKTKQFFGEGGDSGENRDNSTPAECQQEQSQQAQQQQDGGAGYRAIVEELSQLMGQISVLEQQIRMAPPEQQDALSAQLEQTQAKRIALEASMPAQGQQGQGDPSQEGQQSPSGQDAGPSAACKQAIVNQQKAHMEQFKGKITNNMLPTFNKVDTTIDKIQAKIPNLKEAGVDAATITKIESNISRINSDAETVKGFFNGMLSTINAFLEAADSNPDQAFEAMKNRFGSGAQNSAATSANDLVAAFEDLETIINGLK